jgi:hypothetical protein
VLFLVVAVVFRVVVFFSAAVVYTTSFCAVRIGVLVSIIGVSNLAFACNLFDLFLCLIKDTFLVLFIAASILL